MNQDDGNWADDEDEMEEMHPDVEALKPVYLRLMQRRTELEEAGIDKEERRAVVEEIFKEQMRLAFLTHAIATEDDFERLWPRLRDDMLCGHTSNVFLHVMEVLAEELSDEE
jgi:hypothetical protein